MQKRLDGGYGWFVVFAHFMIGTCAYGILKSSGVMFTYFQDEYNGSYASVSTISLSQRLSETSTALIFSFLAERFGSRPIMLIGGVLLVVGTFCSAFARSIFEYTLSFGIPIGLGHAMCIYPGAQMLPKYFDKKLAMASAFALTGGSFGPLVFPFVIRYSIAEYGFSGSFWILAGIYLHVFVSATIMRPPPFKKREEAINLAPISLDKANTGDIVVSEEKVEKGPSFQSMWKAYKSCLCNTSLLLYYFSYMVAAMSSTNFMTYQQPHARDRDITDKTLLALLSSIWGISEIFSKIIFAFVLQSGVILPYRLHQICMILMAAVFFFYPLIHSYWIIACCSGIVAFLWSTMVVCIFPTLQLVVGIELCSPALGLICCPIFLAYASVQAGGFLRDYTGSFVFVYYACSGALILAVVSIEIMAWRVKNSIFHKIAACRQKPR